MRKLLTICFLALAFSLNCLAQSKNDTADSLKVGATLTQFVTAFKNLDMPEFSSFFADDVTVFFPPSAKTPARVNGKKKVMDVFKSFFEKVRASKPRPPYLDISPKNLSIKLYGNIAIATFELDDPGALSRRTLVFRKTGDRYYIIHLHASLIAL